MNPFELPPSGDTPSDSVTFATGSTQPYTVNFQGTEQVPTTTGGVTTLTNTGLATSVTIDGDNVAFTNLATAVLGEISITGGGSL